MSKNLSSLNNVYQTQIKETTEQMQGSKDLYGGLHDMISNLKSSVDETNKYTEEMSKLKESISSLNGIYGNHLTLIELNGPRKRNTQAENDWHDVFSANGSISA